MAELKCQLHPGRGGHTGMETCSSMDIQMCPPDSVSPPAGSRSGLLGWVGSFPGFPLPRPPTEAVLVTIHYIPIPGTRLKTGTVPPALGQKCGTS